MNIVSMYAQHAHCTCMMHTNIALLLSNNNIPCFSNPVTYVVHYYSQAKITLQQYEYHAYTNVESHVT